MMKVIVIPNLEKQNCLEVTREVCERFASLGVEVYASQRYQDALSQCKLMFGEFFALLSASDLLVTIGGDGTIIHGAKHAALANKPILGVNLGRLGFLAALEPCELDRLDSVVKGEYLTEQRMLLNTEIHSAAGNRSLLAVNDVVISKGALAKIIDVEVLCGSQSTSFYRADGVIFSTPTGSTAYAMSAGGPIINPRLNSISMTPICPHSLLSRTIVFPEDEVLTVYTNASAEREVFLSIDGVDSVKLSKDDRIQISKSNLSVKLITFADKGFYSILNKKIMDRRVQA